MSESTEQQALFQWTAYNELKMPELSLLHAIPNGGKRHITTAIRLKKEGLKPGVPDIFLPVSRRNYHGLYIEMKVDKNKPSSNQLWWIEQLTKQGYAVKVCWGWEEAKEEIKKYLGV